ncbi:GNAT family N-acetyltransferase [Shivajiella indica]|uniref:GNAT family N-acetyltransferase n=1 Tax=Shivajiella indica TaxID=872115 RepID=A0ABW5BEL4_9BACT
MFKLETLSAADQATFLQKKEIADFLFVQLEQYRDPHIHIMNCLDYALDHAADKGGFVVLAREEGKIVGAVVINKTGMSGYIPENILVYIAVDASQRGKGVGKKLMKTAIGLANGDIALHVEPENPAKKLYESLGFTNKYLEMRLKK